MTADDWREQSCEFLLSCDDAGAIRWADERAQARGLTRGGRTLIELAAPGTEEKLRAFIADASRSATGEVEIPLVREARVCTCSFLGKPDDTGGVILLGRDVPDQYRIALEESQRSMGEIVELNRQILRQKREIEQQKSTLETALRELEESHRGVLSLHTELADSAETLERASAVKSRVVANVSHEFRTPLHTILGLSRLLLDNTDGALSEEQEKQVKFIRTSAEELSTLVDDMLDLSRADAGKAVLRPEKFEVGEFLGALRGMLRPIVTRPENVKLDIEDPVEGFQLETDRGKLSQILRNLISNALKFTENGSVTLTVESAGADVVFHVADTGIGIAPEHFDQIFEEFGQVEHALQARVKGAGLGLPLSRRLAELLGGTLEVRSVVGFGSTFTLTVPKQHPEVGEFHRLENRAVDPARAPILVVEDDRKTIFIYEKYLAMAGFQVMPARTIEDAERLVQRVRPAAIVLDVMLEGETSWSFLARLKKDPQTHDIPVLVVTVTNKEQKARALGADEFWLKPVDQARLLRKLKPLAKSGLPCKVLVIDDDARAQYLIGKHLEGGPFELLLASTGQQGIHSAQQNRPHVILLDFLLREMTAFDVLDELKADPRTRNIPVIIVTSHSLEPAERARLAAETEVILSKESLSREIAINRIRDALRKSGMPGTVSAAQL